ncbi:amidohydrolase family protein [Streptomyces sp. NPDC127197]|uniref:amidohydrolase family protein n=1 Tax=Streptomyces sp. NPDC127197 TaxID=3345388 RepID=UPI0036291C98
MRCFNGVLDRYPNINWVLSHGGGTVPYIGHRMAGAPRVVAAYRELVRRPMAEYLRSVYYDVAVADSLVQVNTMVDTVGTDRMLFGTDWPYSDGVFDREQAGEHDLTRLLGPNLGAHVAGTNALRILPPHRTPGRQRKLSQVRLQTDLAQSRNDASVAAAS